MDSTAIFTQHLVKRFTTRKGAVNAVDGVSLSVGRG
jgi:ABC-type oligopeptide transport system ATPase subunit